jgi:SpoVK/Ycf46/Vps4 family AAA+-type ATPase
VEYRLAPDRPRPRDVLALGQPERPAPALADNPRAEKIKLPLPSPDELQSALQFLLPQFPHALGNYRETLQVPARQLAGATLASVENLLKTTEFQKQPLQESDLAHLKKELVEADCGGLIEFIESKRSLDDLHGQEPIKEWLRGDIALWQRGELEAMPMGYLLCGPVGTGKTFLVECLAGEANVPVVKLKNFRDKWVGSTEGNLEKIFRLLQALGRCYVFVDEADQALGRRDAGSNDAGLSGRIYSMLAEEMSNTRNRGKVLWILASSRPDLIEVDLKRPGRIDVKIPIFPTTAPEEGFHLIRALAKRRGLELQDEDFEPLKELIPNLLTPGAAETLAIKIYRQVKTKDIGAAEALKQILSDYQHPIAPEVMARQIEIAVREASDLAFVPAALRGSIS